MTDQNEAPLLVGKHFQTPDGTAFGESDADGREMVLETGFDWNAVEPDLSSDQITVAANVLEVLVSWWADSPTERIAARKLWVICYLLRPKLFSERSQSQFAKNRGFSKQLFNVYAKQLRKFAPGFRGQTGWKNESRESLRRKRRKPVAATQPATKQTELSKDRPESKALRTFDEIQQDIQRDTELQRGLGKGAKQ